MRWRLRLKCRLFSLARRRRRSWHGVSEGVLSHLEQMGRAMDVPLGGLQDSWQFKDVACNKKGLADLHQQRCQPSPSFPHFYYGLCSSFKLASISCRMPPTLETMKEGLKQFYGNCSSESRPCHGRPRQDDTLLADSVNKSTGCPPSLLSPPFHLRPNSHSQRFMMP